MSDVYLENATKLAVGSRMLDVELQSLSEELLAGWARGGGDLGTVE